MADENVQTAPTIGAQEEQATQPVATDNKEILQEPHIYHYSDPEATDVRLHHLAIPTFMNLDDFTMDAGDGSLWNWYKAAPPKGMKDPVFDTRANKWIENSKNAQSEIIADAQSAITELKEKSKQLDDDKAKLADAVKAMQTTQAQTAQQNLALMKSFTAQTQNTNKVLANMQTSLAMLAKFVDANKDQAPKADAQDTKPADSAQDTTPVADETNNGGNN